MQLEQMHATQPACFTTGLDWFSTDKEELRACRRECWECPVRRECIQGALTRREIHGMWGGQYDWRIRLALGVNTAGYAVVRRREAACLYCDSRCVRHTGAIRLCLQCGLSWSKVQPSTRRLKRAVRA